MSFRNKESKLFEVVELENLNIIKTEITKLDKINGHIILNGHPCKIKGVQRYSYGFKSSRTYIFGPDIFTNKEHSQNFSNSAQVDVPIIKKTEYSLLGIEDNFAVLMDGEGNLRENLRLPSPEEKGDLTEKIINAFEANQNVVVTVLEACKQEMIVDLKEDP